MATKTFSLHKTPLSMEEETQLKIEITKLREEQLQLKNQMKEQEQRLSKQLEDQANLLLSVRKELITRIEQQAVILTNRVETVMAGALSMGKGTVGSELSSSKATRGNLVNLPQPLTNQTGSGSFQGTPPTTYKIQHNVDSTLLRPETGHSLPATESKPNCTCTDANNIRSFHSDSGIGISTRLPIPDLNQSPSCTPENYQNQSSYTLYPPNHRTLTKFNSNSCHDLHPTYPSNTQTHQNNRTPHNIYPTPLNPPLKPPLVPRVKNTVGAFVKESNHSRQRGSSHNSSLPPQRNREDKGKAVRVQPHCLSKFTEWNKQNMTFSCEFCNQKFDNPQVLGGHVSGHVKKELRQQTLSTSTERSLHKESITCTSIPLGSVINAAEKNIQKRKRDCGASNIDASNMEEFAGGSSKT